MSELARTPQAEGEAAIAAALQAARFAVNTREYTQFVKGLMIAAGHAWSRCKPAPGASSVAGRRLGLQR